MYLLWFWVKKLRYHTENKQKNSPHQHPIVSENPWKGWHWIHWRLSQGCRLPSSEQVIVPVQNWNNHGIPSLETSGPLSMCSGQVFRLLGKLRCTCLAQHDSGVAHTGAKPFCHTPEPNRAATYDFAMQNCFGVNFWSIVSNLKQLFPLSLSLSLSLCKYIHIFTYLETLLLSRILTWHRTLGSFCNTSTLIWSTELQSLR